MNALIRPIAAACVAAALAAPVQAEDYKARAWADAIWFDLLG